MGKLFRLRRVLGLVSLVAMNLVFTVAFAYAQPAATDEQLRMIWDRLDHLERQNADLTQQNGELRHVLDQMPTQQFQPSSYSVPKAHSSDWPSAPPSCGTGVPPCNAAPNCCQDCCPRRHCLSCQCPSEPAPCLECPHVSTLQPYWNVNIFGALVTDMLFSTSRPIAAGTPFLLAPDSPVGLDTNTFDLHARQTSLGAVLSGPEVCGLRAGGLVLVNFYDNSVIIDRYGILPIQAFGELKNQDWRIAAGLQFDVLTPRAPNVLPFSYLAGTGNPGNNFRGQVRLERYLRPSSDAQWTIQMALSEPISTAFSPDLSLTEDNGWPNVEGRLMLGLGEAEQVGLEPVRPFEIGVSGVFGQVRRTAAGVRVIDEVWGIGLDFRWKATERFGIQGELIHGQGLGTYNAGILQTTNAETFQAVRTSGGWIEGWYYWTPCVHSHVGYAIDDPLDGDLATVNPLTSAPVRNETYFANVLWDITTTIRLGFEFTWRDTAYDKVLDAEGAGFHTQFRWTF